MPKIALVGMMASGKSTLGRLLADTLSVPLVDVDEEIERQAGMAVARIFEMQGEEKFRRLERDVIAGLLERTEPLIMPLGGGAFIQDGVRDVLHNRATSVYLRTRPGELIRRLEKTDTSLRPLLAQADDWRERIRSLAAQRDPVYMNADVIFPADSNDLLELGNRLSTVLIMICKNGLIRDFERYSAPVCMETSHA